MAGLQVGQAFGMFLLPGFGGASSSAWVPGHPTSMCDSGLKVNYLSVSILPNLSAVNCGFWID